MHLIAINKFNESIFTWILLIDDVVTREMHSEVTGIKHTFVFFYERAAIGFAVMYFEFPFKYVAAQCHLYVEINKVTQVNSHFRKWNFLKKCTQVDNKSTTTFI